MGKGLGLIFDAGGGNRWWSSLLAANQLVEYERHKEGKKIFFIGYFILVKITCGEPHGVILCNAEIAPFYWLLLMGVKTASAGQKRFCFYFIYFLVGHSSCSVLCTNLLLGPSSGRGHSNVLAFRVSQYRRNWVVVFSPHHFCSVLFQPKSKVKSCACLKVFAC